MADYTTTTLLKASLGITDTADDTALTAAITAASRAIDKVTGTTFYTVSATRVYDPVSPYEVWVDRFTDTTGLVVKTGRDGTYTTTIAATDVVAWPYNAASTGGSYCRIMVPTGVLPMYCLRPSVQVTASFGYSSAPAEVAQACLIKAARIFRRKDSPEGIAGTGEFGVARISKHEDPDVMMLLAPYLPPLVG